MRLNWGFGGIGLHPVTPSNAARRGFVRRPVRREQASRHTEQDGLSTPKSEVPGVLAPVTARLARSRAALADIGSRRLPDQPRRHRESRLLPE